MKKLLLTIAFLIGFSLSLYSQNIEPDALYFSIPRTSGTVTKQFSILDSEYKQNNFLLTWQWGNHPRLSEALKMISSHGSAPSWGPKDLIENTTGTELKYIYQLRRWDYSFAMPQEYSNSFTFKPTFTVEPDNFTPSPNDPEHNIWGFRNRGITNPVVTNNKLELTTTTSYTNPVLSNPWRCNNFYKSFDYDLKGGYDYKPFNGKYWRVTLNLRRKNFAPFNNISDNKPVLVIKMPYYLTAGSSGSNGNITFNTKPDYTVRTQMNYSYSDGTNNHTVNRGYQLGMTSITPVDSIVITRNMLPNLIDSVAGIGPDITITFSFIADKLLIHGNNPLFKTSAKDKTHEMIDSIGLDVYYLGNCDILLNYIRVGNPLSDKLWKGEIDTAYHNVIQQHINIIKDKNYRLFRFYGRDEIDEHYELWDAMRYFNKIVGGLAITEGNSPDLRYLWRTEADKQWRGSIALGKTAVPHFSINDNKLDYIDKTDPSNWHLIDSIILKRIGFAGGYKTKYWSENTLADTMNSDYETWFNIKDPNRWHNLRYNNLNNAVYTRGPNTYVGMDYYNVATSWGDEGKAFQWAIEYHTHPFYTEPNLKKLLYSGQNWYQNLYLFGEYTLEARSTGKTGNWDDKYLFSPKVKSNTRPFTGEEARWAMWRSILFGAKGLAYDADLSGFKGGVRDKVPIGKEIVTNGLTFKPTLLGENATSEDILYKDDIWSGLDFIPEVDSATNMTHTPINELNSNGDSIGYFGKYNSVNRDTTAKYLGCKPHRIYYGRKSPKTEMYKIHSWIKNNEVDSLLMNMRLAGSLSKGIRFWQGFDPRYQSNPLNKIIKYDTTHIIYKFPNDTANDKTTIPSNYIKARPIDRVDAVGNPFYEPWDSSLFDVFIHRPISDSNMIGNTVFIGLQNRRTNPQFLYTDTTDTSKKYLKFLSTAEFDDLCEKGGQDPEFLGDSLPPEYWKSYYWKRLGAREITIPFNYCKDTGDDYALLHVTELKADLSYDENWPWWRKERFNNTIDTIIGQNSSLAIKFLPGEGKMFKVEIYKPEHIAGNLNYSNQTKFIVYQDGFDTNRVRYHLVYHKPNPDSNPVYHNVMSVFYRRSNPIDINSDNKQIVWEDEICLSKYLHIKVSAIDSVSLQAPASYYPSITVKQEGLSTKAYVVFQSIAKDWSYCLEPVCFPAIDNCREYLNPISEVILDVGSEDVIEPMYASAIQNIVYGDIQEYGSPMINASSIGNYYTWADSICGIGVAYKFNSFTEFNVKNYVSAKGGLASHPSLNAYSYPSWTENDCSLVWEERDDINSLKSIYYTKLNYDFYGGNIINFLPNYIQSSSNVEIYNNCLELAKGNDNTFPTIYKQDGDPNLVLIFGHSLQLEKIAWVSAGQSNNISMRTFTHFYDYYNYTYNESYLYPITNIVGSINSPFSYFYRFSRFTKPVLSQPSSYNIGSNSLGSYFTNDFLLNFVNNWSYYIIGGSGNIIYHLRDNFYRTSDILSGKSDYFKTVYPVSIGTNVHLAKSQYLNDEYHNVWKNSRVYNNSTQSEITSNPMYFYPLDECPDCIRTRLYLEYINPVTTVGGGGISGISITQFNYEGGLGLVLPYKKLNDSIDNFYVPIKQDTIFTEWVLIDSIATLKYLVKLDDTNHVSIKLQKLSDSSYIDLPAPFIPGSGFAQQILHLVNGNYDSYRLAMVNSDTVLRYTENYYFDEPFVQDTIYSKNSVEITKNIIDLNKQLNEEHNLQIKCMPNPASEILNVLIYGSQSEQAQYIKLELYNQSGILKWQGDTQLNSTITLPINDLLNGVYLVKASILSDNGLTTKTLKVIILK